MKPPNVAETGPRGRPAGKDRNAERRPPGPVSAAWLQRVALYYLERYSASTEMLRRTLARRVDKRARLRGEDPAPFAEMVDATVARAVSAGLVDDVRFADARLATLRRRGTSSRGAAAKLAAKGVPRDVVEAAMQAEREAIPDAEAADIEIRAAHAYAKRRRLGVHRRPDTRALYRDRDLGALARAGFSYDLARRVVDADPDEPD
ncbi:RecX family transcriptional regulator [Methylobacterium sp. WL2]|uniref:regulatory protein RecX n=1 Tax=unclassified Methylobacterium TaxID=2615210 RepID=UPI0011CC253A|nr:RecX family transcriptional regulator [Methylobacterium sp. WL2]TXN55183.1 regulatory protein RecX [Methylobacterium sp. WL2]